MNCLKSKRKLWRRTKRMRCHLKILRFFDDRCELSSPLLHWRLSIACLDRKFTILQWLASHHRHYDVLFIGLNLQCKPNEQRDDLRRSELVQLRTFPEQQQKQQLRSHGNPLRENARPTINRPKQDLENRREIRVSVLRLEDQHQQPYA